MGGIEVIELGKIDRCRGGGQVIDVEPCDHFIERHYIVFRHSPTHQDDPVEHTFGDVAKVLHVAQKNGVAILDRLGRIPLAQLTFPGRLQENG